MVLDNQDYPQISCYHLYSEDLYYGYQDESDWVFEMVDDEDDSGPENSLVLDSNGYPHIAYDHNIFPDEEDLRYALKDVDGWHIELVDDEYSYQGGFCSLALDSQDHAHIAYLKYGPGDPNLNYAHWDGSQWLIETVDVIGQCNEAISIIIDSQDHPHIAYSSNWYLRYAHWDGNEWLIEELDVSHGDISLALDSQEYPHIAYCCYEDYWIVIKYARWNGSQWEIESAYYDDYVMLGQFGVSLDLNSEDNPHISCDEYIDLEIWYIWFGDPLTDITLDHFSAQGDGSAIAINWSVETTPPMAGDEQITGFNLYRREINNNIAAEVSNLGCIWTKVNTGLITGQNPYSYTDSDVEANVAYEYKLEAVLDDDSPETLGTTQATAGLQPTSFAILALFPNPASDYLTCLLAMPEAGLVEIALYDLSGRLVLEKRLEATEPTELGAVFDVSGLASGVYTLRASYDAAEASARAVVVR